jgi:hypothetical protein
MSRKIGLPTKVSLNDPIEFLELSKDASPFLGLNLEEIKGGAMKQLLCGHLVAFIQKNKIDGIKKFPRFKIEYLEEILLRSKEKGIDLLVIENHSSDFTLKQ